jgi:hypothetical protein
MDARSIAFYGKEAALLVVAAALCLISAWLVMRRRWVIAGALGVITCVVLDIVHRVHNNEL